MIKSEIDKKMNNRYYFKLGIKTLNSLLYNEHILKLQQIF